MQATLFEVPLLPGLAYRADIVDAAEEEALLATLASLGLAPFRFQGWLGKRETASFGWAYDFDNASVAAAPPMPPALLALRDRAAAFAGVPSGDFVHALVTRYDPGAGIGWHRDRPVFEEVVGVSLLSPCTLRLRQRTASGFARTSVPLARRSAYLLTGEARHRWEHGIAPMEEQRWSITFRTLSEKGRAAVALPG